MTYEELMVNVRAKLPSRQAITANWIQCRYRVLQMMARRCIQELQEDGSISREWDPRLGGYEVLHVALETKV